VGTSLQVPGTRDRCKQNPFFQFLGNRRIGVRQCYNPATFLWTGKADWQPRDLLFRRHRRPKRPPRSLAFGKVSLNGGGIFDVYAGPLPSPEGSLQGILRDSDHLLGRFGEAAWLCAVPKTRTDFSLRGDTDRVWAMLEGGAWVVLHDLRESSPSRGRTQVLRLDRRPLGLLLIPFGVAAGLQVLEGSQAGILVLSTLARGDSAPEQTFSPEDPVIGFDWSSLGSGKG